MRIPTFNELARRRAGPPFRDSYIIHTPIDDENHLFFITQLVPVTGEAARAYKIQHAEVQEMLKTLPTPVQLGMDIIAGRERLRDWKQYPELPWVEDILAQVSQDPIVDRRREKMVRSDVGVVYLRRLMARELQAFAQTGQSKPWAVMREAPVGLETDLR